MRFPRSRRGRRGRAAERTAVDERRPRAGAVEEEEYVRRWPRPPLLWPWLLLFLLLVLGGLAAAYYFTRDDNDNKSNTVAASTVPGVLGLKQDEAVQRLNARGLTPRITAKPSKSPAGVVFAQDPSAGTELSRHSPVAISVSATQVVRVPNVVGVPTAVAIKRLRTSGLSATTTRVASAKPPGTVLRENPAAGASVAKGSTVSLRVSKGRTTVPNVVGQQEGTARAVLRGAGLLAAVFRVPGAEPKGTVIAQKPQAGKKVARGSKVRINVSTGSQTTPPPPSGTTTAAASRVKVPNVVGLQQSAAQRRLHSAGLGVRVVYVSSSKPSGRVVDQTPVGGTMVRRGTRVRIDVSLGSSPATETVPNVVGQTQDAATSRLQAAGFTVQVIMVPPPDPSQAGVVIDEQPAGGTRAPRGSQVTIYVGQSG